MPSCITYICLKVPAEFVVQHNENANPPTFFITMETLLSRMEAEDNMDMKFLSLVYPRLQAWFSWFNTTQVGNWSDRFSEHEVSNLHVCHTCSLVSDL